MATKLVSIKAFDYYDNPKEIDAMSFFGGREKGMMVEIKLRQLEGLKAEMGIELNREQALLLAKSILEKFESQ